GLDAGLHAPIQALSTAAQQGLGAALTGITVVGSCLTDDFRPGQSDINTVLLLNQLSPAVLDQVTQAVRPQARKHRLAVPLLMTVDYIERSRDVFGIELLDFQLTHQTVLGDDPFRDLSFNKADVRLQCERELKADLIRLRQGYITAAGKDALIRDVLIAGVKSLAPLLRAMLWLKDKPRETRLAPTWQSASENFGIHAGPLQRIAAWRHEKTTTNGLTLREAFEQVYKVIDQLATIVDEFEE
ncbi:hypothetical protein ACFL6U_22105, partial [Planctomycetota bacterium]